MHADGNLCCGKSLDGSTGTCMPTDCNAGGKEGAKEDAKDNAKDDGKNDGKKGRKGRRKL